MFERSAAGRARNIRPERRSGSETTNLTMLTRPFYTGAAESRIVRGCVMGRIQQCVKDVLSIAKETEDFGRAKTRIEQLFVASKAKHHGHLAVAQRVRDQINGAYNDVPVDAQPCLNQVLEWLDRKHLRQQTD